MTPMLLWNPEWETGSPEIDHQHRQLMDHIDQVFQAVVHQRESEPVARTLQFLADYVEAHFGMEEALMDRTGYPRSGEHRVLHAELRARVQEFIEGQLKDPAAISEAVPLFLSDWLINHIDQQDRDLAQHARTQGQVEA